MSKRQVDKPLLRRQVLIKNTFDKLDKFHADLPRNVICKVQKSQHPQKMYILYIRGKYTTPSTVHLTDFAGFFTHLDDAFFVKNCLNDLFTSIHDDTWGLKGSGYMVRGATMNQLINAENKSDIYIVEGQYKSKQKLASNEYCLENVIGISDNRFKLKDLIKRYKDKAGEFADWKPMFDKKTNAWIEFEPKFYIKEYYVNDVMPTMYIKDYSGSKHKDHIRKIMGGLQNTQTSRALR